MIHDRIVDCCPLNLYTSNAVRILFMQSQKARINNDRRGRITVSFSIIFFIIGFLFFMDLSNRVESCLAFSIFQIHSHQKVEADGEKDNGNYKQNPRYPFSHFLSASSFFRSSTSSGFVVISEYSFRLLSNLSLNGMMILL